MKYNTGKASHQISAGERAAYEGALHRDQPTQRQKGFYRRLLAIGTENGVEFNEYRIIGKLETKNDYNIAIRKIKNVLIEKGLYEYTEKDRAQDERRAERRKKYEEELNNTEWISLKERKPDCKFCKTLDRDGRIRTLEWSEKHQCFVSPRGQAVLKKFENITGIKKPERWAYL